MNGTSTNGVQSFEGLDKNPLRRAWRGNKEGTIELKGASTVRRSGHMAAALRYWGKCGFGEGISGHITVRDPVLPDHYWMNPIAEHFSTMTKSMLVLVGPDGYVSPHGAQLPINTSGFHIHSAIHKARPEIKAAAHCHSLYGKTWSAFGRPIDMLTQDSCFEGENIAAALGSKWKTCIMQNHGLLTLGHTVDEAVFLFSVLDRLCQAQLLAEAAEANGIPKAVISKEDAEFTAKQFQYWENGYVCFQPEYKLLLQETNEAFLK
ncbi:arad-like aldolase/epimerase [Gymnopus androsaceus JB14]|uniref:Arad-like aldolase/epimerase n=1 Tax=Gymnopus androsaceus JB14 TaxID=1447944 RepID=A0A6A4GU01_9AGAR|nr:arad-like aldolase/epimerase [Gymnopus androsaceus JB14]